MRVTLISKGAVAEIDTLGAQLVSYQDVVSLARGSCLLEGAGAHFISYCRRLAEREGGDRRKGLFHGAAWLCPAQGIYPGDYQERDGGVLAES